MRPAFLDKILIANRGEIACRIARTAKQMGIKVVSVFSSADKEARHTEEADESYHVGPAPSSLSYLDGQKIVDIAQRSGSKAVHPGYGFLSENHQFAELLESKGIIFIGPPVQAMKDMASKSKAKEIMASAGVPVIPGYNGKDQNSARLRQEARNMGYPVMIKASLGGGGKGMRIVFKDEDFDNALGAARNEAKKFFADDSVIIEKYIKKSRHIEVQIFGDQNGKIVSLFERDCSVQRRHQKILEEAPSPSITPDQRNILMKMAVEAAAAVKYVGAGTVEFIYDCEDKSFYFMEMNTRLQVEHPVTEMITGQDLVQWQLLVSAGHGVPKSQNDLEISGHAIEARVYAEKTNNNFLPDVGQIKFLKMPQNSKYIRIETGIRKGDEISLYYDPMIAKVIAHGNSRNEALAHLGKALAELEIVGLETNLGFLRAILQTKPYQSGTYDTDLVPDHMQYIRSLKPLIDEKHLALAAISSLVPSKLQGPTNSNPWLTSMPFQNLINVEYSSDFNIGQDTYKFTIKPRGPNHLELQMVQPTKNSFDVEILPVIDGGNGMSVIVDGIKFSNLCVFTEEDGKKSIFFKSGKLTINKFHGPMKAESIDGNVIKSPMTCRIVDLKIDQGAKVTKGQILAIVEAMKMEHFIVSPGNGIVEAVMCSKGDISHEGQILLKLKIT